MALRVDSATGAQPYSFSARVVTTGLVLLNNTASNQFTWAPAMADTGYQQLMLVVRDNIATADTLFARILVVPANRPCSLSVAYRSPTVSGGIADLNALGTADTLTYHIHDPDDPRMERHTVSVYFARAKAMSVIDSTNSDSFHLFIDPTAFDGYDTVAAVVEDVAGHTDTLVQVLYYGVAPNVPQPVTPALGQGGVAVPTTFTWLGGDDDGDSVTYELYLGTSSVSLSLVASVATTTYTHSSLAAGTQYYWRVLARDWRSSATGPLFRFTTQ
jgi:hypothetical protein